MAGRSKRKKKIGVPPYRIPSMSEIEGIEPNGFIAASTFSGGGGSCLGYRWAGFDVRWASEFVPVAQEIYRLNHPNSILDTRDVREVQPDEILRAIGIEKGELDLFDGSPPCDSFSLAGKREKLWGKSKKYCSVREQRTDDLTFEYIRLVDGLQPKVFVAENVKGLVVGKAKGYFKAMLRGMKECGYRVSARVLDAQWLGVPQRRQRLIFVGVRNDLGIEPRHPTPYQYRYSIADACPWIRKVYVGRDIKKSKHPGINDNINVIENSEPSPTVMAYGIGAATGPNPGPGFISQHVVEADATIEGYAIEREWEKLRPGEGSDKYLNLVRAHPDRPSPTITQTAGSRGAAGVTHPYERRKFSMLELKRICGFPDDFKLVGTYTQQWGRLGMSVPPPMTMAIGKVVEEILHEAGF